MTLHTSELLAPAGDRACFVGALSGGADAVYLAGQKFGARAYAGNFTSEELVTSIREAHALHRRVYLTANILTREDELDETVDFVCEMAAQGLDGVIVQDLGVASRIHAVFPTLPIHASTQMSVTAPEAVQFLKSIGVSRIVPARELSLEEIALLKERNIEIEAFIHGAMCYSYSGRCLFSSFLGGRSGNRGRCAGTCRLPFMVLDGKGRAVLPGKDANSEKSASSGKQAVYPVSMKDMTVLEILPELLDAGIDSFKIEGRMKRPEYAAGVTSIYRKYIDRYVSWTQEGRKKPWRIEPDDLEFLSHLYIRTARSSGYYHLQNGPSLITIGEPGYAGTEDSLLKEIHDRYCTSLPARAIGGRLFLHVGEPAGLYLYDPEDPSLAVYTAGDTVQAADRRPLSEADIRSKTAKTGGTPFAFDSLEIEADTDAFLTVSALGRLRREALDAFWDEITKRGQKTQPAENENAEDKKKPADKAKTADGEISGEHGRECAGKISRNGAAGRLSRGGSAADRLWTQVETPAQYEAAARSGISQVILDMPEGSGLYEAVRSDPAFLRPGIRHFAALPEIMRVSHREDYRRLLKLISAPEGRGIEGILARTADQLGFLREENYSGTVIADAGIYTWNTASLEVLSPYCAGNVLPLEMSGAQLLSAFGGRLEERFLFTVYGRLPMMVSAGCVRKTSGSCVKKGVSFWALKDRIGVSFPVRTVCGREGELCHNTVLNAHPLSLHNYLGDPLPEKAVGLRLIFTTETGEETAGILSFYLDRLIRGGKGPQPESALFPDGKFTTGHYLKGAL